MATVVASLAVTLLLLPPWLGGRTSLTVVSGSSMEPTYHTYDLALTYRGGDPRVGDVIVYRIPAGDQGAGEQVIHRVIGGDADLGYLTQGDNREGPDQWRPRRADVVGTVLGVVPQGARYLAIAFNLGTLAVVAVVLFGWALWPRPHESARRRRATVGADAAVEAAYPAGAGPA